MEFLSLLVGSLTTGFLALPLVGVLMGIDSADADKFNDASAAGYWALAGAFSFLLFTTVKALWTAAGRIDGGQPTKVERVMEPHAPYAEALAVLVLKDCDLRQNSPLAFYVRDTLGYERFLGNGDVRRVQEDGTVVAVLDALAHDEDDQLKSVLNGDTKPEDIRVASRNTISDEAVRPRRKGKPEMEATEKVSRETSGVFSDPDSVVDVVSSTFSDPDSVVEVEDETSSGPEG